MPFLTTRFYQNTDIQKFFLTTKPKNYKSSDENFELFWDEEKSNIKLNWISSIRPMVGFQVSQLELELPRPSGMGFRVFHHGYQSWSITRSYSPKETVKRPLLDFLYYGQENVYTKISNKKGEFTSEGFLLLYSESEDKGYLAGLTDVSTYNAKFKVVLDSQGTVKYLGLIYDIYSKIDTKKKNSFQFAKYTTKSFSGSPEHALEEYYTQLGKLNKAIVRKEVPTGWCSWYYYYTGISEEIILKNLYALKKMNLPVHFFQIDDGYQKAMGDWLIPNSKFPNGLKHISNEITKLGYVPGIWTAPFLVRQDSELFQKYPETLLKDRKGNYVRAIYQPIWGKGYTYSLDVTHPSTIQYLETVFDTLVHKYKFTYLKLDFLYAALLDGEANRSDLSPVQRYRFILSKIRKVVGPKVFLLGCGAPILPSIGLFEGMRVGCDVTPFWAPERHRVWLRDRDAYSTRNSLINTITRSQMHRRFWLNDPDCLLVRKEKNKMTPEETMIMASVLAVSGGMLLVSDDLELLEKERVDLLRKALRISHACQNHSPIPIQSLEKEFPNAMFNPGGYLGIWNPSEKEEFVRLNLPKPFKKPRFVNEFTGEVFEGSVLENGKRLEFLLPPKFSAVLAF